MKSWNEHLSRGLYHHGEIKELRNKDPISLFVARECAIKARLYYPDLELLCRVINSGKGIPYYGDAQEIYNAVGDGKLTYMVVNDKSRGETIRLYPDEEYFKNCVVPLLFRFGIEQLV
jgi:hypothetical protein